MAEGDRYTYIGNGVYSVPEAHRMTGVDARRIRRWLAGYKRTGESERRAPRLTREYALVENRLALGFMDLIEVRIADAFLENGMRWPVLWRSHQIAKSIVGHPHPFATGRFRTDGNLVFEAFCDETEMAPRVVLDILRGQLNFGAIVAHTFKDIDFATDHVAGALRWWPMGRARQVVVDPQRSFGQAVVAHEGVPTSILAQAVSAEGSVSRVARWYVVSDEAVTDAVEWESRLAQAA